MAEPEVLATGKDEPMIVHAHATPWGFLVALPLAMALGFLGAWQIDASAIEHPLTALGDHSISLFGAVLVGFSLYLFLVGVGELASYLKPAVEVVLDREGIAVYGLVGQRRMAWRDLAAARVEGDVLLLLARRRRPVGRRSVRLQLSRLAIDPKELLRKLQHHRPDLVA